MKILIVGKVPTHPVRMGNSRLIVDQTELLTSMGHEVHYLYVNERHFKDLVHNTFDENLLAMKEYWGERLHVVKTPLFLKIRNNIINRLRYALCCGYVNADDFYYSQIHHAIRLLDKEMGFGACIVNYYYLSKALTKISIPIKALLTHDIYTFRDIVCHKKIHGSLTPNEEAKVAQRSPNILCVQEDDAVFFGKLSPESRIFTTFTTVNFHPTPIAGNHNILFLSGASDFNLNGIRWFINDILPLITAKYPDAKLIVGGGICKQLDAKTLSDSVVPVGFVDDVERFFAQGDIAINPTFQGTGLKIKTFEALSYGKVTITHPHSTLGIFNRSNAPLYVSDNPVKWLNFVSHFWTEEGNIADAKARITEYLEDLNSHIKQQYKELLSNQ